MATTYDVWLLQKDDTGKVFNNKENGSAGLNVSGDYYSVGPTRIHYAAGTSGDISSGPGAFDVTIPANTFNDGVNVYITIFQVIADINTGKAREYSTQITSRTPKQPVAKNCYPNQGFINHKSVTTFGWEYYYEYNDFFTPFRPQLKADFVWRVKGTTTEYKINNFSVSQPKGTVPENTFPAKSFIEWRVALYAQDTVGARSPWYQATTTDAIPTAPTRLLPNGEFFESGQAITLTWSHNVSTASPQYAFDLELSRDNGGSWVALATHTVTSTQQYVVQAGAVPTGKLLWRVRTYNTDNVASPWAQPAQVILVGAPEIPAITSIEAGKSRPVVVWNSLDQESAQLVFEQNGSTVYDSGDIFGGVSTHKVAQYLADGTYTVKVRVKNAYDIWSGWASAAHTITTVKQFTVKLTGVQIKNGVQLTFMPVENGGG